MSEEDFVIEEDPVSELQIGADNARRSPMIPMTTSNSTRVKPVAESYRRSVFIGGGILGIY
jgi:hypothetical protein